MMEQQSMEEEQIKIGDVIKSLTEQVEDYAVRLAHKDADLKLKVRQLDSVKKRIKELEMENRQLHEGKETINKEVDTELDRLNLEVTPDERGHRERKGGKKDAK